MADGKSIALLLLFFVLGTSNTIVTKVIFTLQGSDKDGDDELFHKPAFGNWNMFFGMVLVLIPYFRKKSQQRSNLSLLDSQLLDKEAKPRSSTGKQMLLIAVPAIFDVFGTGLSLVGIILIPASVWQMLRGAQIIFAAILTVTVLKRRLFAFHWLGVSFALAGIIMVSISTVYSGGLGTGAEDVSWNMVVGVGVTIASQIVAAAQIITEERLLVDLDMDEFLVVGVEGVWGLLIMTFAVYPLLWLVPGSDHGHVEDPIDTIDLIKSSHAILFFVVMDFVSCAVYNVLGQQVTKSMSGMMRVMLEATRTMFVWIFNLSWHYFVDSKSMFGEAWTSLSYLEAFGFVFLIIGQTTYSEFLKWPVLYYPEGNEGSMPTPRPMCSPKSNLAAFASPRGY